MVQPTKTHAFFPCAKHNSDFISTMSMYIQFEANQLRVEVRVQLAECFRLVAGDSEMDQIGCRAAKVLPWRMPEFLALQPTWESLIMGLMIKLMIND